MIQLKNYYSSTSNPDPENRNGQIGIPEIRIYADSDVRIKHYNRIFQARIMLRPEQWDFNTYNDERLKHAELCKNYTEDYDQKYGAPYGHHMASH
uniref:Uncharacterized protein n=1 Tax=Romanomermis culicivorax TaxID=13658 RepID=A0A915JKY7_ROMCU